MHGRMSFLPHIEEIISKSSIMLGFIERISRKFCDPYTHKTLYTSLVYAESRAYRLHLVASVHFERLEWVTSTADLPSLWWKMPSNRSWGALKQENCCQCSFCAVHSSWQGPLYGPCSLAAICEGPLLKKYFLWFVFGGKMECSMLIALKTKKNYSVTVFFNP
jgi:hypothetical protein